MTEQDLQIPMPAGTADAVLFTPDPSKQLPGVLYIPDIASIREANRKMASRLAAEGYTLLMPNQFYRTGRPPVFSFDRSQQDPETRTRTMERMKELIAPLAPDALNNDLKTYIDFLTSQPNVKPGKIAVVGFCIGGGIALRAAAVEPDKVAAVASFHGGGLYKENDPASPHLVLPKVKARLYFGHADEDKSMNAEDIAHFEATLKKWGGKFESEIYTGSHHGWTVLDNPAYNEPGAEKAYTKLTSLLKQTLN
jgi:carboxymethylenebutenolidase